LDSRQPSKPNRPASDPEASACATVERTQQSPKKKINPTVALQWFITVNDDPPAAEGAIKRS
jgi:hypothetical protein